MRGNSALCPSKCHVVSRSSVSWSYLTQNLGKFVRRKEEKLGDIWVASSGDCERGVWNLMLSGVIYKSIYHCLGRICSPNY